MPLHDPSLGRYIESDPIGLKGGLNTYAYVNGNALRYVDPYGLNPGAAAGATGGFFVGGPPGAVVGGVIGFGIGLWGAKVGWEYYNDHKDTVDDTGRSGEDAANDDIYESDDGCIFWYEELMELKKELTTQCLDDLTKKAINDSIAHYNRQCGGYTPHISQL